MKTFPVVILFILSLVSCADFTDSANRTAPEPDDTPIEVVDLDVGDGDEALAGQTVEVHYTGWLYVDGERGEKFDSSVDRNEPYEFILGACKAIHGWDRGVQGMRVGGRRELIVPPSMAYGSQGFAGAIPPNATLDFEVELLRILATPGESEGANVQIIDHQVGDGGEAVPGCRVEVHYTGWLVVDGERGEKFDSSVDRGEPYQFGLGDGQVIRGWDEGVAGMKVGGRRELIIPPEMGYGAAGAGGVIPPDATLNFEIELLRILR